MTKRLLLLAAPLSLLAGCGSTSSTVYTITTGSNYNVSGGVATANFPADNCNMVELFQVTNPPSPIHVVVNGTSAQFDLKGDKVLPGDAEYFTTATINGNSIDHVANADYATAWSATCATRSQVQVNGEILANDSLHLVAKYDISVVPGTSCTAAEVGAKTLPCTSEVDFEAAKP